MINFVLRFFLNVFGGIIPTDAFARKFPVSVKGIIFFEDKVLLLQNERSEWDLPGGKIINNESVKECLKREVKEETNLSVFVENIIDVFFIKIVDRVDVLIVLLNCSLTNQNLDDIKISFEHRDVGLFSINELDEINIKDVYRNSIKDEFQKRKN